MKDEATPEQLAMARRIAEATRIDGPLGLGPPNAVKAALAAIIETTELAAAYVQNWDSDCDELAYDLRSGDHLKGRDHG